MWKKYTLDNFAQLIHIQQAQKNKDKHTCILENAYFYPKNRGGIALAFIQKIHI